MFEILNSVWGITANKDDIPTVDHCTVSDAALIWGKQGKNIVEE